MTDTAGGEKYKVIVGVETELPLTRTEDADNQDVINTLVEKFRNEGLHAVNDKSPLSGDWIVALDDSIVGRPAYKRSIVPVEIQSPPMDTGDGHNHYIADLAKMWKVLTKEQLLSQKPEHWQRASNNIHFSVEGPGLERGSKFPIEVAKPLAFAAIFFERAIDGLMPFVKDPDDGKPREHRRLGGWKYNDRFTQRIRVKSGTGSKLDDLASCWHTIQKTEDIDGLKKNLGHDQGKNFKWSFRGYKGLGATVEFRQMPPTRKLADTLVWIDFVKGFLNACLAIKTNLLDQAAEGNTTFFEALLGNELPVSVEEQKKREKSWAADQWDWEENSRECIRRGDELRQSWPGGVSYLKKFMGPQHMGHLDREGGNEADPYTGLLEQRIREFWERLDIIKSEMENDIDKLIKE